jgi:hypothetical protein
MQLAAVDAREVAHAEGIPAQRGNRCDVLVLAMTELELGRLLLDWEDWSCWRCLTVRAQPGKKGVCVPKLMGEVNCASVHCSCALLARLEGREMMRDNNSRDF